MYNSCQVLTSKKLRELHGAITFPTSPRIVRHFTSYPNPDLQNPKYYIQIEFYIKIAQRKIHKNCNICSWVLETVFVNLPILFSDHHLYGLFSHPIRAQRNVCLFVRYRKEKSKLIFLYLKCLHFIFLRVILVRIRFTYIFFIVF